MTGKSLTRNQKAIGREKDIKTALRKLAENVDCRITVGTLGDGFAIIDCGEDAAEAGKKREVILISGNMKEFLTEMKRYKPSPERATKQNSKGQKVPCLRLKFQL